ncbi:MAG: translocation/assembly module TamB domain-containing protein [Desulfosoma sp.]
MGSIKGQAKTPPNASRSRRPFHGTPILSGFPRTVIVLGVLGLGLSLCIVLLMHTPWVQDWMTRVVVERVHQATSLQVAVRGFRWSSWKSVRFNEVSLKSGETVVLSADSLDMHYSLSWSKPHVTLRHVTLHRPFVRLEKSDDGRWRIPLPRDEGKGNGNEPARRWVLKLLGQVTVVSGRVQGFEGERCILDVSEMTGTLWVRQESENGSLGVQVSLDPWRMELQAPVRSEVSLTAGALLHDGILRVDTLQVTVNETSHIALSGTWYDFPAGSFSAQVRLMPWSWTIKGWGPRQGEHALSVVLKGSLDLEGTPARLYGRYDLQGGHGNLVGTALWTITKEKAMITADMSITELLVPWDIQGASTFSGKTHLVLERKQGGETKISFALRQGRYSAEKMTLQDLTLNVDFQEGIFVVRRAAGRWDNGGLVEASGTIVGIPSAPVGTLRPTLDLDVKADRMPLALLKHAVPDRPLAGMVSGQGKLQGTWPHWTWKGRVSARDVIIDAFRAKTVRIDGTSTLSCLKEARKLTMELSAFAYGEYTGDFLSVTLHQQGEATMADMEVHGRRLAALDHLNLKAKLTSLQDPHKRLRIEEAEFSVAGDQYTAQGELRIGSGAVQVSSLRMSRGDEEVQVHGTLGIPEPLDLSARIKNVDMASWLPRFLPEASRKDELNKWLRGRLDAQVRLQGTVEKPVMVLDASVSQLAVPDQERFFLALSGRYEAEKLTLHGELFAPFLNNPVLMEGTWPLELRLVPWTCSLRHGAEGQVRSSAQNVPLESLRAIIPLKELKGSASWDVRLRGSLKNPHLEGSGTVHGASFLWPGWTEKVQDLEVQWRAEESSIRLEAAQWTMLGSRGQARGDVFFSSACRFDGYTVHVVGDDVRFPAIFGIQGQGAIRGTVNQKGHDFAPEIVGEVILHKTAIHLGELEKDVARQIRLVEETGRGPKVILGTRRNQPQKLKGFQNVAMQLKIQLPSKDAWARGFGLEAEVHGAATLSKARGGPIQLHGTLWTSRGEYTFQGVRMRVVEGELTFRGETPPDPFLSLTCQKDLRDVSVTASLTGPLSRPTLVFSSSPEMDQVDIVSVLLYGRPARELNARQTQELQDRGVQFVLGGTTPMVKSLFGGIALSPDAVDIKGTENGSVLEIGKYLTPALYVRYQKSLEGNEKDELRTEYRVNRFLSVESEVGREDRAGVDVFFRYDFGQ